MTVYWICFGDSAKGCLAMARKAMEPALNADYILALADDYSQGDIRDVTDRAARADILTPWRGDPELDGKWQTDYQAQHWKVLDQLDEVDEAVIWYTGGNALEQCGLRYVVGRLYQRHIPVWVAEVGEIPLAEIHELEETGGKTVAVSILTNNRVVNALLRFVPQPLLVRYAARLERRTRKARAAAGGTVRYSLVGEMEAGAAAYFYKRRRQLTETEQATLLTEWTRMQEENAPLRAMVNGKVRSVPADFYDETILSCVPEEESHAALTIGRAIAKLDKSGNRISDMLIFSRVRALGAAGKLEIVQDGLTYRDMTIRKIGG